MDSDEDEFQYDGQGLPIIHQHNNSSLASLLRRSGVPHANGDCPPDHLFWPDKVLQRVLSQERLAIVLHGMHMEERQASLVASHIIGTSAQSSSSQYLKVMALLILLDIEKEIFHWINSDISDASIPFAFTKAGKLVNGKTNEIVQCTSNWSYHQRESFAGKQWRLYTPYFELSPEGHAQELCFEDNIVLPWCKLTDEDKEFLSWKEDDRHPGAFGTINGVLMRKSSHGFTNSLEKKLKLEHNGFALKRLHPLRPGGADEEEFNRLFQHEVKQLKRFSGHNERHLVLLLVSFEWKNDKHFLFPHADCTLSDYWGRNEDAPPHDNHHMEWLSQQLYGLMNAVWTIHKGLVELGSGNGKMERRYGRHGDIRPDNILWFRTTDSDLGILVLADMGLSTFNSEVSKSYVSKTRVTAIPVCHPPECVVKGGKINRTFDVWSLGCVFLEAIAWALGGLKYLQAFRNARTTPSMRGWKELVFYEVGRRTGKGGQSVYSVKVKPQVIEWISKMHAHEDCNPFMHDVLDTTGMKMLTVLSDGVKRTSSKVLADQFKAFNQKLKGDYYTCATPDLNRSTLHNPEVEAELDFDSYELSSGILFSQHQGDLLRPPTPKQLSDTSG